MIRVDAGTVLGGRYQLTVPIASGGMGEVWEARDELLGRTVAVKVLRSELASDHGFLARFRTEARNSARLVHPAIATTYDYGESGGSAWLVMELVPGEPLSDLLATQGSVEPRRAMQIISSAASGLAAAHAAGIVHRDVKPGNLMVMPNGGVKVTDFGIARAAAEAPLTATGQVMGTAAYLSPEQATGRRDLTSAVDVYALGVVAHEMLAGQRPFTGESQVAIALAQVNDPPPPLPASVPAGARALVDACLAKDPRSRPRDASVVAHVAGLVAEGDDLHARQALRAGLGSAGDDDGSTVALPPAMDATGAYDQATRAMTGHHDPLRDQAPDETVPWPEPAPGTRRSAQAAAAAAAYAAHEADGTHDRGGAQPEPTGQRGGRGRMTVPLIGLIAVLVVVLAALAYALVSGNDDAPVTPQTPLSTPGTSASASSPTADASTATRESASSSAPSASTPSASASASQTASASDPASASASASASDPASPSASAPSASGSPTAAASPTTPAAAGASG